jgi:hypothetical protein
VLTGQQQMFITNQHATKEVRDILTKGPKEQATDNSLYSCDVG